MAAIDDSHLPHTAGTLKETIAIRSKDHCPSIQIFPQGGNAIYESWDTVWNAAL